MRHGETAKDNLTYYTYNAANELTQLHDKDGWMYFAYDANGNTVMEQTPSYAPYYDWDGRDMLTGVRSTEEDWTDNIYRYDGLASRASTLESSGFTYYDWDSINVIQEKTGTRAVLPPAPTPATPLGRRLCGELRRGVRALVPDDMRRQEEEQAQSRAKS